jgi:hypothetical protein
MMRSPYRRKFGFVRANHPRRDEASQRANEERLEPSADRFDWVPERELVIGTSKRLGPSAPFGAVGRGRDGDGGSRS